MITAEDAEFHTPIADDPTWAETNYFGFYVPELRLNGGVYALFRPSLGVVNTTVSLNSRKGRADGESVRDCLYPVSTRLRLVDRLDREWNLEGAAQTTLPWQAWPDVVAFNVLHEWRCDGRTGLGEAMDFLGMSQVKALYNGLGS
jgi:hypothetical protein